MDKNNHEKWAKVKAFFKKNGYYFLIVICIGAVATMIGVAVSKSNATKTESNISNVIDEPVNNGNEGDVTPPTENDPIPDEPTPDDEDEEKTMTFIAPVNGSVTNEYSTSAVFYNKSLNKYQAHEAMDFESTDDLNVYASCDGTVIVVDNDTLNGNFIVIEHANGYKTKYCSLANGGTIAVGDTVKSGDVIGTISNSMNSECLDGDHLHFEVYLNDELINPIEVLILEEK